MSAHTCRTLDPLCYRCDLNLDEMGWSVTWLSRTSWRVLCGHGVVVLASIDGAPSPCPDCAAEVDAP